MAGKSFFSKLINGVKFQKALERRGFMSLSDLDKAMDSVVFGRDTFSGVKVSNDDAFTVSAFYCGVLQIAQTVASLPLDVFQRKPDGQKKYLLGHDLTKCLSGKVNKYMSSYTWKELQTVCMIMYGNSYSWLERNEYNDRVQAIYTLHPEKISVRVVNDVLEYIYKMPDGKDKVLPNENVLHMMGLTNNGYSGIPLKDKMMQTLGLAIAQEEFQGSYYKNGAHVGGALTHPGKLTDPAKQNLRESINKKFVGSGNAWKYFIFEEGMKFEPLNIKLVDAQFQELRNFTIQEIARWLNMPPHKLKDLSRSTYSNIEAEQISWLQDTIRPWLVRIEQAVNTQAIDDYEQSKGVYSEFNIEAMLRADIQSRYNAYSVGLNNGFLSRNEVRGFENLNPIDGGEIYTVQLALTDLKNVGKPIESEPERLEVEDDTSEKN